MMILVDLEKAWNAIHPVKIEHTRSEINPQFVSIVPPSDLVITVPFGIEIEQFTGIITLCIPYSNIEPIKAKLYSGFQSDQLEVDDNWIQRFYERLKNTEVELKVELGRSQLSIQDFFKLKIGDVISLEKDVSEPLLVQVEGIPKFLGRQGVYGSNRAIQVEARVQS